MFFINACLKVSCVVTGVAYKTCPFIVSPRTEAFITQKFFIRLQIQGDTKKRELLKNPTKIEEIQEKTILSKIEPLQLAF